MDEITRKRLEHNEQVFRHVNEEIDERAVEASEPEYVCECSDTSCLATVRLTHEEYNAVREHDSRFFVVPGHHRPELERVVEQHATYYVVEKS